MSHLTSNMSINVDFIQTRFPPGTSSDLPPR